MKRVFVVFVAFLLITVSTTLLLSADKKELIDKIEAGATIIDVRTAEEFAEGHHKKAINIPVSEIEDHINKLGDKKKPVIVYCRSGKRSAKAAQILSENGFTDVTNAGTLEDMPE